MHLRYSYKERKSHGHERSAGGGATAAIATREPSDKRVHTVAKARVATASVILPRPGTRLGEREICKKKLVKVTETINATFLTTLPCEN